MLLGVFLFVVCLLFFVRIIPIGSPNRTYFAPPPPPPPTHTHTHPLFVWRLHYWATKQLYLYLTCDCLFPEGNLNAGMGDEFMVAADLTLYGNPLRCLTTRKKKPEVTSGQQATEEKPKTKSAPISPAKKSSPSKSNRDRNDDQKELENKRPDEGKVASSLNLNSSNSTVAVDTIAADLTKYNSPLDDKI